MTFTIGFSTGIGIQNNSGDDKIDNLIRNETGLVQDIGIVSFVIAILTLLRFPA